MNKSLVSFIVFIFFVVTYSSTSPQQSPSKIEHIFYTIERLISEYLGSQEWILHAKLKHDVRKAITAAAWIDNTRVITGTKDGSLTSWNIMQAQPIATADNNQEEIIAPLSEKAVPWLDLKKIHGKKILETFNALQAQKKPKKLREPITNIVVASAHKTIPSYIYVLSGIQKHNSEHGHVTMYTPDLKPIKVMLKAPGVIDNTFDTVPYSITVSHEIAPHPVCSIATRQSVTIYKAMTNETHCVMNALENCFISKKRFTTQDTTIVSSCLPSNAPPSRNISKNRTIKGVETSITKKEVSHGKNPVVSSYPTPAAFNNSSHTLSFFRQSDAYVERGKVEQVFYEFSPNGSPIATTTKHETLFQYPPTKYIKTDTIKAFLFYNRLSFLVVRGQDARFEEIPVDNVFFSSLQVDGNDILLGTSTQGIGIIDTQAGSGKQGIANAHKEISYNQKAWPATISTLSLSPDKNTLLSATHNGENPHIAKVWKKGCPQATLATNIILYAAIKELH